MILLLALALACDAPAPGAAPAEAPAAQAPSPDAPPARRSLKGRYAARVLLLPDPPPMSQLFEVQVELSHPETGAPIEDARVAVDARMPQHGHGMSTRPVNEPPEGCAPEADCPHAGGLYRTTGMKFHMPGAWTIQVDIDGPRGADRVVFVYEMPA